MKLFQLNEADDEFRRLERLAGQGDEEVAQLLARQRVRMAFVPDPKFERYDVDLIMRLFGISSEQTDKRPCRLTSWIIPFELTPEFVTGRLGKLSHRANYRDTYGVWYNISSPRISIHVLPAMSTRKTIVSSGVRPPMIYFMSPDISQADYNETRSKLGI